MREWLSYRAKRQPDTTAVIDADRDESWTYAELDEWVETLAGTLQAVGVEPGERIGILVPRRPADIAAVWAGFRVGGVLVPLDVNEQPDVLRDGMTAADLDYLVVDSTTEAVGLASSPPTTTVLSLEASESTTVTPFEAESPVPVEPADWGLDDTWLILFTSGTTGDPKGVRLTPRNLGASAAASAFRLGVTPRDRWLLTLPTYHMGGLSIPVRSAIYGTTVVLERDFDVESTMESIDAYEVTGVSLVPTMLKRLIAADWRPQTLRFALVGGAPTPPHLAAEAVRAGIPIYPTYGMTETASQVATATPAEVADDPDTVGRPLDTVSVTIVSDDSAAGDHPDAGPIVVSGPVVSPGYLEPAKGRRSDEAAYGPERNAGFPTFRTGDRGYLDDGGRLFVVGRESETIITGGELVAPAAVERVVMDHPAVEAVSVVGLPDAEWGERVAALVVSTAGLSESDLVSFLDDRLADYKVPKTVAFAEELPRTSSGTVDRRAVRRLLGEDANGQA